MTQPRVVLEWAVSSVLEEGQSPQGWLGLLSPTMANSHPSELPQEEIDRIKAAGQKLANHSPSPLRASILIGSFGDDVVIRIECPYDLDIPPVDLVLQRLVACWLAHFVLIGVEQRGLHSALN